MHLGLDLDNTLIDYESAFAAAAVAAGAVRAGTVMGKTAIRDCVRALPDGEARWMAMQAYVYGPGINAARLFDGVTETLRVAQARNIPLVIVSHKSEFAAADPGGPSLRVCAQTFLERHGIGVPVVFASTREEKCRRIAGLGVTHFIDDLVEVFAEPAFPAGVARWLFAPHGVSGDPPADRVFSAWSEIRHALVS